MPISFEPAQPLDVAAAAAYGANQSFQQALPAIAHLYASAGQMNAAGQQHALDRAAQGQQAIAGLSLKHGEFVAQQDQQAERDKFESTRGFEMQQQRFELSSWLNNQELTQKETLRLQQMQNAVADVTHNDELSGEEKQNLVMKLKTGIDVYKQRQEKALAAQEEAHAKAYVDQAKRQTQIANANASVSAQTIEQRTSTVFDAGELQRIRDKMGAGATDEQVKAEALRQGAYSQVLHNGVDQYGNIKDHVLDGHGRSGGGKGRAEKPDTRFGDEHGVFSYKNALPEAKAEAEAAFPVKKDKDGKDANAEDRAKYMQEVLTRMRAEHGTAHGGTKPASEAPAGAKPFGPDEQANDRQRAQIETWSAARERAQSLPIQPQLKAQYTAATYVLDALLRKYGAIDQKTAAKMADDDKANYEQARTWIARVESNVNASAFPGGPPTAPAAPTGYAPPWGGGRYDGGKQ